MRIIDRIKEFFTDAVLGSGLFGKDAVTPAGADQQFAFCESITATAFSKWHIRRLTSVGKKLGGGADTPALCGHPVAWDLNVNPAPYNLAIACPACIEAYTDAQIVELQEIAQ